MTFAELLGQCTWAGTFILIAAFAADRLLRVAPAAWRHFLWTVALAGLLLLPALVRVTPKWGLSAAVSPASASTAVTMIVDSNTSYQPAPKPWNWLLIGWLTGCSLAVGWFLLGRVRMYRMVRRSKPAVFAREILDGAGGESVRVLESETAHTAMAVGIWRPAVLLPLDSASWPAQRLRAVLLHELMHIQRRDLAAQAIAQAACCLYWFHPLSWMAALRLRRERECACDDAVLGHGLAPHEYAEHLVAMVRALRSRRSSAMAMAEPSELESRVRALLDTSRDRWPLSRTAAYGMVTALAVVLLPLTVMTVRGQAAPPLSVPAAAIPATDVVATPDDEPQAATTGAISGTVEDPTGARVPNIGVTARNLDSSSEVVVRANPVGEFQFPSLPAGRYQVSVQLPGFKTLRAVVSVEPNKTVGVNARLEMGELSESITISAARSAAPEAVAAARPADPRRIRVGGNVQAAKIITRVNPVYPEALKASGVSGIVHLKGIVTKQGYVSNLQVLNTDINPALAAAAMDAASQWRYQPSLLNGEPADVMTNIDINFELVQ